MGSAFHLLCPRYSGTLTPTAPTATMEHPLRQLPKLLFKLMEKMIKLLLNLFSVVELEGGHRHRV